MKIYTKSGDAGKTSLIGGSRVSKGNLRIDLYGEVDELNSFLGSLRLIHDDTLLETIQNQLFCLGSLLACEPSKKEEFKLPPISNEIVSKIEASIDQMNTTLDELKNFILPSGCEGANRAHLCRVIARRVERKLVNFLDQAEDEVPEHAIIFLNRLSDYFFVLARFLNKKENISETLWKY